MNGGKRAIRPHDYVRAKAADVASHAIPVKRVSDQVKTLEHFEVHVKLPGTASDRVSCVRSRQVAVDLEASGDASGINVKQPSLANVPVEGRLRDDVRVQVRCRGICGGAGGARTAAAIVKLS